MAISLLVNDHSKEMDHCEHTNLTFTDGQVIALAFISILVNITNQYV